MLERSLDNCLTKVKNILSVIICVFWVIIALFYGVNMVEKKHVYPLKYKQTVIRYAKQNEIESALVFAVIKTESSFREKVVSKKGAVGLMQILPSTAEYVAKLLGEENFDLKDATTNIRYGCKYIRYLLDRFSVVKTAICAYNAGEGKVEKWLKDKKYSSDGVNLEYIPYKETSEYLEKIEKSFIKYKKLYGKILDN